MNTAQFWALSYLIHEQECLAEEKENAAGVLFYADLQDALCALMPGAARSSQPPLLPAMKEGSPGQDLASILQLSTASREGLRPKEPQQGEGKVPRFEELQAAYRKACTQ